MMTKNKIFYLISILLLVLNLSIVIFYYHQKTNYHVDEIFSYGHANSSQGAFLHPKLDASINLDDAETYILNRWLDGSVINNYITVQPEERFKYRHIFENMAVGVHPPLFYIFLHTVCSFTPDTFSKWQGAALNIPLWIVLLIMMYKLSERFCKDKYLALLPVIFYAFSQVGLNTVIYIRGYLMQTLWAVCLTYETICLLQEKNVSKKRWCLIFLFSLLGMLTQYNSIIYSAIIGIVAGLVLLFNKRYKHLILLALVLISSLGCLFAVFPDAINVLLHSSRAKEIADISLYDKFLNFIYLWGITKNLSLIYTTALWSFHKFNSYLLLAIIVLAFAYKYLYTNAAKLIDLLAIIYVLMCLYAEFFMPEMHVYNMRYIMLVIPLIAIVTFWYLAFILKSLKIGDIYLKIILSFIIFINALCVDFAHRSPYAFQENTSLHDTFKNKKVIWSDEVFNNFYISGQQAKTFYIYEKKITEEKLTEALDNSDYYAKFNPKIQYQFRLEQEIPESDKIPAPLSQKIKEKLTYLYSARVGIWYYDIYKVNKSVPEQNKEINNNE